MINVFKNNPRNKDIIINVAIFFIGNTPCTKDANPIPNSNAIGTKLKNLRDGTVFPTKYVTSNKTSIDKYTPIL